jgi:hypothetical protein
MEKQKLRIDSLSVESFATDRPVDGRGTVRGQGDDGCTYVDTCLCKTAYYHCGTGPETIFSCDYTNTWRCWETAHCPTPPITPAC